MPFRRLVPCAFCALAFVLAIGSYRPTTVEAGQGFGFQPVDPAELKMTSEPLAPGAPAIILYRQVDRDDNGTPSHQEVYFRIKILTEEGRKYGNIEIPFYKESEQVRNIKARTIKPDGSIVDFDGKVLEQTLVKGRGVKYVAKTFALPNVEVGSILEYFFSVDFKWDYVYGSSWILSDDLFTRKARFSLQPLTHAPMTVSLLWSWHELPPGAEPKQGAGQVIRMDASNIPAFQTEDYMPPENELKSRVDFNYLENFHEKGVEAYWKAIGTRWNGYLEAFVGKQKAMQGAVAQIVSPDDAPEVKLRKIYDRVQQIRNKSYELGKTEQEQKRDKEKIAENVEDVWKRGYGNGVQLTWLYLALVRAAGFETYGVWASDRRNYFFDPGTMESGKLDTNVVLVKLNGKDLYLDPGAEFTPFGLLPWSETGVQGLQLNKDGGTWVKTTLPASSESRVERKAKFKLSESGDLEGKLTITFTGLEALYDRLEVRHSDEVARKKFLEEAVKGDIPATAEAELTNKPDWTGSETPLVAEFDVKIPGWSSSAGKRVVLPAGVFTAEEKHLFEHANRVHPIYFEYPYETLDDVTIELPAGWHVGGVPAADDKDTKIIGYSRKVENDKDTLHLTRKLRVDFLLLEPKFYSALRNFYEAVRSGDEQQIILQPGAASASN